MEVPDDERQQVARRRVGPVRVLDDPHERRADRQPAHHPEQQLQQAALRQASVRRRRRLPELWYQARKVGRASPTSANQSAHPTCSVTPRSASTTGSSGATPPLSSMQPPLITCAPDIPA